MDGETIGGIPAARRAVRERGATGGVSRVPGHGTRRPAAIQRDRTNADPVVAGLGDHDPQVAGDDVGAGGGESGSDLRAADGVRCAVASAQLARIEGGQSSGCQGRAGAGEIGGWQYGCERFHGGTIRETEQAGSGRVRYRFGSKWNTAVMESFPG